MKDILDISSAGESALKSYMVSECHKSAVRVATETTGLVGWLGFNGTFNTE